jgi:UDP-3-O-[3-hydroxymyristoyl] glucosamine N-acyltransferase
MKNLVNPITLDQILYFLRDEVLEVNKKNDSVINKVVPLFSSDSENGISFCENKNLYSILKKTSATILIVSKDFDIEINQTIIKVNEPRISFIKIIDYFFNNKKTHKFSSDKKDFLNLGIKLGKNVRVSQNVFIGSNVIIGDNCTIYPNVTIYPDVVIGSETILHAGSIIGSDGFHFHRDLKGQVYKFPSIASVNIGSNVEIGSNSTIDCGTLIDTVIGNGVKIDNLVHIGHSVEISENVFIAAGVIIGGNTKIKESAWIGCNVTLSNNINLGQKSSVTLGSTVISDVQDYKRVTGNFAYNHLKFMRNYSKFLSSPDFSVGKK